MAPNVTVILNNTQQVLHMKVGNHRYFVDFAKIGKGGQQIMRVDYYDTYQEFLMGPDCTGKDLILTSDDCCDYKCITINEVQGKFVVDRVPRMHYGSVEEIIVAPAAKKQCVSSWNLWKLRI